MDMPLLSCRELGHSLTECGPWGRSAWPNLFNSNPFRSERARRIVTRVSSTKLLSSWPAWRNRLRSTTSARPWIVFVHLSLTKTPPTGCSPVYSRSKRGWWKSQMICSASKAAIRARPHSLCPDREPCQRRSAGHERWAGQNDPMRLVPRRRPQRAWTAAEPFRSFAELHVPADV